MASPALGAAQRGPPAALSIQLLKQRSMPSCSAVRAQQPLSAAQRDLPLRQQHSAQSRRRQRQTHHTLAFADTTVAARPQSQPQQRPRPDSAQGPSSGPTKQQARSKQNASSISPSQVESLRLLEWPAVCQQVSTACHMLPASTYNQCLADYVAMPFPHAAIKG